MLDIFKKLESLSINYIVCSSIFKMSFLDREHLIWDYFIVISEREYRKTKDKIKLDFEVASHNHFRIRERDLTQEEIDIFHKNKEKYNKVRDDQFGKIYEVKCKGFKL